MGIAEINPVVGEEERVMKIGSVVEIKKCDAIPGVVGEHAEIVRLQIQEFEKYTVYPVWVKVLSGERKGKIYGFQYDEVEVLPEAFTGKMMKTKMVEQLEEILRGVPSVGAEEEGKVTKMKVVEQLEDALRAVKIGGVVEIKKCDSMPELVGEHGEIVEMQIQEFEKYTVYPVWVKVLSGERKGKIYGFQYDEVEVLPKAFTGKMMKTKMIEQLEEILRGITTFEDIAEIERAISEVKGSILAEPTLGFWEGKTPCWEMLRCPEAIRNECPAFKHRGVPCWQIEGTYSKLLDDGQKGYNTDICRVCRVYKRWGRGEPIEIKLLGKGFNHVVKAEPR